MLSPSPAADYCYWSVADGAFARMAETMVASARNIGVTTAFHIWSDQTIAGATVHRLKRLKTDHYLFKFDVLRSHVRDLPYHHFVWLDADTCFVRNPGDILRVLQGAPVHASLESDLCSAKCQRQDWRGCPLPILTHLMRAQGVRGKSIYNVNGGFWVVAREAIEEFYALAMRFWETGRQRGYYFTEEAPLAYAAQMLCSDPAAHQLRLWTDVWVTDWQGAFAKRLPDGRPWIFRDYFTLEPIEVNPAIVHAVASKHVMAAAKPSRASASDNHGTFNAR